MSVDTVTLRMRVVFVHPENGSETDQSRARRLLVLNAAYVVERVQVLACETLVWLEGKPEFPFNSVQFENANEFIAPAKTPRMALAAARPIFREAFKHVPLDLQVKATIALAELDASITAHFPGSMPIQAAQARPFRQCGARDSRNGPRCKNEVALDKISICAGPHVFEPSPAQVESVRLVDPARPQPKLALVTFPPRGQAATTSNNSTAADDRGPSEPR